MTALLPNRAYRAAYKAQQAAFLLNCLAAHRILRTVSGTSYRPGSDVEALARRRYDELLELDLRNVEQGYYPRSLLFQVPLAEYARVMPSLVRDFPRTIVRAKNKNFKDLPAEVELERYPPYFRRNFHWQTDGYLSRRSADLYDVGVEFLFLGTADIMRRQVIPPLARGLSGAPAATRPKILDVACGTGRTLRQIAEALPDAKLYGLDLSPYYVGAARRLLRHAAPDASFLVENAESIPLRDDTFDAVVSVFLFHELPRAARRNTFREMYRVLKPGGTLVIEDSAQYSEAGPIAGLLERFAVDFHEPYYRDYLRDELADLAREVGFSVEHSGPCFVSKIVVAKKPALAS